MFNLTTIVCCLLTVFTYLAEVSGGELLLAEGGRSDYQIVMADDASPSTKHGAEELQSFLEQITGVKLPIVSDQEPQGPKEIVLGNNARLKALGVEIDFAALGDEGYVIRTVGDNLIIAGGALRGNMYGVYGFLEDHLGCRWFAPGVSRIPKHEKLVVGPIDDRQVPVLELREPFTFECFDGDWCARNRMNSHAARLEMKLGGKLRIWGLAHTFAHLLPVEKYFESHPEYFSLVKGKRQKENPQLCCTNPEVMRICAESMLAEIRRQPETNVFGISQNDWDNHCECDNCQAVARQEESQMGPVLQLVNYVAEAVEKEFPDKTIQTLAYQWTRKPPKNIRPRPNVVIQLCSIECCFAHPLATCDSPQNQAFRSDIEAWSKVAPRIWVWDYVTNFTHYLMPFPNQRVRAPNIRFFVAHNVKGIFEQDTYNTDDSELAALGGYMTAKLLWNPDYNPNVAMNEFLEGYYGPAAAPIRKYIDLIHDYVEQKNIHVGIFVPMTHSHLTDDLLMAGNELWQQAEQAAAEQGELLDHVRRSRLSMDYAILERARLQAQGKLPRNEQFMSLATVRFGPYCEVLRASPLTRITEWSTLDKDAYCRELAKVLGLASH